MAYIARRCRSQVRQTDTSTIQSHGSRRQKLHHLEDLGIITRVDHSEWATPIVVVQKPNGKARICGDYEVTVNRQLYVDQHPIPRVDELYAKLQGGQHFSKLDMSDAYLQVELDDATKKLLVVKT